MNYVAKQYQILRSTPSKLTWRHMSSLQARNLASPGSRTPSTLLGAEDASTRLCFARLLQDDAVV